MGGLHHSVLGSSRLTNPADNPPKDREILSRGWGPPQYRRRDSSPGRPENVRHRATRTLRCVQRSYRSTRKAGAAMVAGASRMPCAHRACARPLHPHSRGLGHVRTDDGQTHLRCPAYGALAAQAAPRGYPPLRPVAANTARMTIGVF